MIYLISHGLTVDWYNGDLWDTDKMLEAFHSLATHFLSVSILFLVVDDEQNVVEKCENVHITNNCKAKRARKARKLDSAEGRSASKQFESREREK